MIAPEFKYEIWSVFPGKRDKDLPDFSRNLGAFTDQRSSASVAILFEGAKAEEFSEERKRFISVLTIVFVILLICAQSEAEEIARTHDLYGQRVA